MYINRVRKNSVFLRSTSQGNLVFISYCTSLSPEAQFVANTSLITALSKAESNNHSWIPPIITVMESKRISIDQTGSITMILVLTSMHSTRSLIWLPIMLHCKISRSITIPTQIFPWVAHLSFRASLFRRIPRLHYSLILLWIVVNITACHQMSPTLRRWKTFQTLRPLQIYNSYQIRRMVMENWKCHHWNTSNVDWMAFIIATGLGAKGPKREKAF